MHSYLKLAPFIAYVTTGLTFKRWVKVHFSEAFPAQYVSHKQTKISIVI